MLVLANDVATDNTISRHARSAITTPSLPLEDIQLVTGGNLQAQTPGQSRSAHSEDTEDSAKRRNATASDEQAGLKGTEETEAGKAEGPKEGERSEETKECKGHGCTEGPKQHEAKEGACGAGCRGQEEESEKEEGEAGEKETGNEALEEQIEDLMEQYMLRGQNDSLAQLMTMYPGLNMSAILADAKANGEEDEVEGSEHMGRGVHPHGPLLQGLATQSLAPNGYGDYVIITHHDPTPPASEAATPDIIRHHTVPPTDHAPRLTDIAPTPVQHQHSPQTEGGAAQLVADRGSAPSGGLHGNQGEPSPGTVGLTTSGTVGVVLGTVVLSWLLVGPGLCLAWRWGQRRQERKKICLQRAQTGSVDEGILEAMVSSELGRRDRRQTSEDVQKAMTQDPQVLQSFPTPESHVV
ncbi:hypothetical protein C0Q70_08119 [Pomacea canaliculata]|uniref:Uncharacterized protein n=1 Tax=Pomacea canaliculata TaxID=400727 RepID=A0A2T7PGX5_POMCA|nr:hypothetical protein C0Q70_08119 [Pomacea canaliculata]